MKQRSHTALARAFRKSANAPEEVAWRLLRTFRAHGFPVRRQHQIGRYIVDFAVTKGRLAIEIDGAIHKLPCVADRDADREEEIKDAGWRVLRVDAETAMSKDHFLALVQRELGL